MYSKNKLNTYIYEMYSKHKLNIYKPKNKKLSNGPKISLKSWSTKFVFKQSGLKCGFYK